jgi:Protein of unknown function (DUF1524)
MSHVHRRRRVATIIISFVIAVIIVVTQQLTALPAPMIQPSQPAAASGPLALTVLQQLPVKGRAPKTDYSRQQFGNGWSTVDGCDTRNIILNRDMTNVQTDTSCNVTKGTLSDPYTGKIIQFTRGNATSGDVQIDHVVALSNAWQTGAQSLTPSVRSVLANDPLELLAVDGPANQQKSDGDAATWLPSFKPFRCQYVARQIAVKHKYQLWVTFAEKNAMLSILTTCPDQTTPNNS